MWCGVVKWRALRRALVCAALAMVSGTALADDVAPGAGDTGAWDAVVEIDPRLATIETWTGGSRTGTGWALYHGMTWSPFGTLREDGFRIRASGAQGRSTYDGIALVSPIGTPEQFAPQRYVSTTLSGSGMIGYQLSTRSLTIKAFGGIAMGLKRDNPYDPSDPDQRRRLGAAGALEGWLDLGRAFIQLDTSFGQIDRTANARLRAGWRITDDISIGPEASAGRSRSTAAIIPATHAAYGAFARMTWDRGEVSASAGIAHDSTAGAARTFTVQYLYRY